MPPNRVDGVTGTVLEMWCVRDYGLRVDELKALLELRLGAFPGGPRTTNILRPTAADLWIAHAKTLLPTYAKRRMSMRAVGYVHQLVKYMYG